MTLSVFPGLIPTRYTAPGGSPLPSLGGPLGRTLNAAAWRVGQWTMRRAFDGPINDIRAEFGQALAFADCLSSQWTEAVCLREWLRKWLRDPCGGNSESCGE